LLALFINKNMNEAIIISDIHIGSEVCQSKKLLNFLIDIENNLITTNTLIINGDLFDSWDFRKLKKSHWKILSQIRKLSKNVKLIWISGNHDGPAEMVSHLIGVDFIEEHCFISGDKKILVLHGDIFDNFISKYPIFTKIADHCYRWLQRLDRYYNTGFYYSTLVKRSSKTFLRCSEQICERAKQYCLSKKCNIVCCGHTHLEMKSISEKVEYYNSGCWTESSCTYISINQGIIKLNNYTQSQCS